MNKKPFGVRICQSLLWTCSGCVIENNICLGIKENLHLFSEHLNFVHATHHRHEQVFANDPFCNNGMRTLLDRLLPCRLQLCPYEHHYIATTRPVSSPNIWKPLLVQNLHLSQPLNWLLSQQVIPTQRISPCTCIHYQHGSSRPFQSS